MKHGFLLVDKPVGPTSHDIVAMARKSLNERKIGHLGTLDPAASGLMVLAVGRKALKVVELFEKASKQYIADVRFGAVSTTYDAEGVLEEVLLPPGVTVPTLLELERMLEDKFTGQIDQVPPAYSALHIEGKRAYELARAGKLVEMPTRQVNISALQVQSFTYPQAVLRIECSSGTYIRSLAHELGQAIRCGAYLQALRRTHVGAWSVDFAVTPEAIGWSFIMPLKEVLDSLPAMELTALQWHQIGLGQSIDVPITEPLIAWYDGLPVALLEQNYKQPELTKARKVF